MGKQNKILNKFDLKWINKTGLIIFSCSLQNNARNRNNNNQKKKYVYVYVIVNINSKMPIQLADWKLLQWTTGTKLVEINLIKCPTFLYTLSPENPLLLKTRCSVVVTSSKEAEPTLPHSCHPSSLLASLNNQVSLDFRSTEPSVLEKLMSEHGAAWMVEEPVTSLGHTDFPDQLENLCSYTG